MANENSTGSEIDNVHYLEMGAAVDPSLYDDRKERVLKSGNGGGTSGGMSQDWKTSVDNQLGQLHRDLRMLLTVFIAAFIVLGSGGWIIYSKLSDQSTALQVEQAKTSTKVGSMDRNLESIDQKLDALIMAQNSQSK